MAIRPLVFGALPEVNVHNADVGNPYPVLLVFDNKLIARIGTSVFADSEAVEGDMAAAELLTEYSYDRWRSGSVLARSLEPTPEVAVEYPLGESSDINWLSYHWSNLLVPWRVDLYRGPSVDPESTLLGTTDWVHPIVKSVLEDFSYDEFPWLLGPSEKRILGMAADRQLSSFYQLPTPVYGVDHVLWRFDVSGGVNGLVDFLQAALMIAGRSWQPGINMSYGANLAPIERSIRRDTAAGVSTGIDRPTGTEISFSLEDLTAFEAQTQLFTDWVRDQPDDARVVVYKEPHPADRLRYYDGGAFIGTRKSFDGVSIEAQPGQAGDIFVEKSVKGIKIRQTE